MPHQFGFVNLERRLQTETVPVHPPKVEALTIRGEAAEAKRSTTRTDGGPRAAGHGDQRYANASPILSRAQSSTADRRRPPLRPLETLSGWLLCRFATK